jgi:hypothetical protein
MVAVLDTGGGGLGRDSPAAVKAFKVAEALGAPQAAPVLAGGEMAQAAGVAPGGDRVAAHG